MMLKKRVLKEPVVSTKSLKFGGRAIVVRQFSDILKTALDSISSFISAEQYRLCGAAAGLFQGVFQPVSSIDLLGKTYKQVDDFAQAMQTYPQVNKPAFNPSDKVYKITYLIRGVEVGMMVPGPHDVHRDGSDDLSPWQHYTNLVVGSYNVPAEALELRLADELTLDRPRHYQPLIKHLQKYGADVELLQRAMEVKALSRTRMTKVLSQIRMKP